MRHLKQVQWLRVAGDYVVSKRDKEFASNGKQKGSVREETNAVSSTTVMSVQNQQQKPLLPLSHLHKEVKVRREKGPSEVIVHLGSPLDSRAKTSRKLFALNYFLTICILPNVSFLSQNRVENSAIISHLHTGRLKVNPAKSREGW